MVVRGLSPAGVYDAAAMSRTEAPPGRILGDRYQLGAMLGEGGMASVYRAVDLRDGSACAVKVLAPDYAHDKQVRQRFVREANAARSLDHPNIIRVFESDAQGPVAWMSMELLEGQSLEERLALGPLSPREALALMIPVSSAVAAAHAAGIIHRDLKPANIFMCRGGAAKVLDFGIARNHADFAITGTREMPGTPAYLSPEQCRGKKATAASDLYALGVTLFEALAGALPFTGSATAVIVAHANKTAPLLRERAPDAPESLEALVARLLAKDPAERPPTADALKSELEAIVAALPPAASEAFELDTQFDRPTATPIIPSSATQARIERALDVLGEETFQRRARVAQLEVELSAERRALEDLEFQVEQLRGRLAALFAGRRADG